MRMLYLLLDVHRRQFGASVKLYWTVCKAQRVEHDNCKYVAADMNSVGQQIPSANHVRSNNRTSQTQWVRSNPFYHGISNQTAPSQWYATKTFGASMLANVNTPWKQTLSTVAVLARRKLIVGWNASIWIYEGMTPETWPSADTYQAFYGAAKKTFSNQSASQCFRQSLVTAPFCERRAKVRSGFWLRFDSREVHTTTEKRATNGGLFVL